MKRSQSMKIFIACALGAGIGTEVSLQVHPYFWWVGMLVGGFIGYISYEFRKVLKAVKETSLKLNQRRWSIVKKTTPIVTCSITGVLVLLSIASTLGVVPLCLARLIFPYTESVELMLVMWIVLSALGFLSIIVVTRSCGIKKFDIIEVGDSLTYSFLITALVWSPFYSPWYSLYVGCRYIYNFFRKIRTVTEEVGHVLKAGVLWVKDVFVLIHSEIRLLCLFDAAIGSGVGYFAGSVLIGAIVGGIFGVLNFKVVSKRLLKLLSEADNIIKIRINN